MKKLSVLVLILLITPIVGYGQLLWPGVARMPLAQVDVSMPQVTGITHFVPSGGNLQAALDAAQPGDAVELEAGSTFVGRYNFYNKPDNSKWIIVRSSRHAELPEGHRVSPSDAPKMAAIIPPDNLHALDLYPSFGPFTKARRWRFVGIEVKPNSNFASNSNLIKCGTNGSWQTTREQAPEDIIFDRCYVHGLRDRDAFRGIIICSKRTAIINSYFSEFHAVGFDTQAILVANSPGVLRLENNYIEGAGENFMSGGLDLRIQGLVPSDITFRLNHVAKPPSWNPFDKENFLPLNGQPVTWTTNPLPGPSEDQRQRFPPRYVDSAGNIARHWSVKNLFELKNAERVLIEENFFENNWSDAQSGMAILFTPRNQDGANPWAVVRDVNFINSRLRNVAGGISILGRDDLQQSQRAERIVIRGNTFEGLGSPGYGVNGRFLQLLSGADVVVVENNSCVSQHITTAVVFDGLPTTNLVFTDNLFSRGSFGVFGRGLSEGIRSLNHYAPGSVFLRNVLITNDAGAAAIYPQGNYFAKEAQQ